ncbi:hypothetical protein UPYG_G00053330, partial [Umbra pygmaea]
GTAYIRCRQTRLKPRVHSSNWIYPQSSENIFFFTNNYKKARTMADSKTIRWSTEEVHTFLCLVAKESIQRELVKAIRNEKVYQELSQLMGTHGFQRSCRQCREKLKKLKSDYRSIKDSNGQKGSNRKTWKWFDQMDAIYKHRPANNGRTGGHDTATALMESLMEEDSISEESSPSSIIQQQDDLPSRPAVASTPETAPVVASTPLPSSAPQSKYYKNLSEESSPSSIIQQQDDAPSRPAAAPKPETAPVAASTLLPSSTPQIKEKRQREQDHIAVLREMQKSDVEQQELNRAQRDRHLQMALEDAARARELEAALRREENASAAAFNEAFLGKLSQLVQAMSRRPDNTQPLLDSLSFTDEDVWGTEKYVLGLKIERGVKEEEEDIILNGHKGSFSKKQA